MNQRYSSSLVTSSLIAICMFVFSGVACSKTVIVDPDGSADFTTILSAVSDAGTVSGDVIIVRPGIYAGNINMSNKAITLRSTDPTDGNIVLTTIINGGSSASGIICNSGEGSDTVIEGFLIRNGVGTISNGYYCGGGMYNDNGSSPTVNNCTFSNNTADIGGGMYNYNGSSPTVSNCTFSNNTTIGFRVGGGGMYNYESSPVLTNCTFSGNTAYLGGGMINDWNSSPVVTDCIFSGNTTTAGTGAGMTNWRSSPTITRCTFSENTAAFDGGGLANSESSPIVTDCTFSGNTATYDGGGMHTETGLPEVSGSYFCTNMPNQVDGPYTDNGGNIISDDYCPPPRSLTPETARLAGDIDASGTVDLVDFAIIADQMQALITIAENWLLGTD